MYSSNMAKKEFYYISKQDLQAGDRVMFEIELADGDKIAVGVEHVKS